MFIVLMTFLIISSILVLIAKRNKETLYIFGMCMSLAIFLSGIMIYIAKKGGISQEIQQFFYINSAIKTHFQYLLITLDHLGYIVAIGKFLFPLFLLLVAMHYSAISWLQRSKWIKKLCLLPPVISLILYYPNIFYLLPERSPYLSSISQIWIVFYMAASAMLLVYEAFSIQIRFIQRQFILIISFVFSLTFLYFLYYGQDPGDIYQFYIAGSSIYYIKSVLSVPAYLLIVLLNVVLSVIAFTSLFKYANGIFASNREEIIIQRKMNSISTGTSVFVHSIKNQLLSNRVIHKRLNRQISQGADLRDIKTYTDQLSDQNEMMLARMEELYRSVKAERIHLTPVCLKTITNSAVEKFQHKFQHHYVHVDIANEKVLADPVHLSEAIYNLLVNAREAVQSRDEKLTGGVYLRCFYTRQYTVVEVKDEGTGMSKREMKNIFDPFYSSKNSNHNWGMGLHYVRTIVKEHFGILRYESEIGKGTTFFMLLPKLKKWER